MHDLTANVSNVTDKLAMVLLTSGRRLTHKVSYMMALALSISRTKLFKVST